MRELLWGNTFRRALRRTIKRQPHVLADIEATLRLLQEDPFSPQLASHKLKGRLAGTWALQRRLRPAYPLRVCP